MWTRKTLTAPCVALLLVTTLTAPRSEAQSLGNSKVLKVWHLKSRIALPPYSDTLKLGAQNELTLRGQSVAIVLAFRNPFLFSYQSEAKEVENEQHKVAASFATTLTTLLGRFQPAGGTKSLVALSNPSSPAVVVEGLNVREALGTLDKLKDAVVDIPNEIEKSLLETEDAAQEVKDAVKAWKLEEREKEVADAVTKAEAIVRKCAGAPQDSLEVTIGNVKGKVKCTDSLGEFASARDVASAIVDLSPRAEKSLEVLRGFAEDAQNLGSETEFGTFAESATDRIVTVTATPVTKYQRFFSATAKKRQADALRTFAFGIRTYSPVILSLGPAVVVRFRSAPKYGVEQVDGGFKIVRTDSDQPFSYNLAAMLNVAPSAWANPTFTPYAQIGIDPAKDNVGFYAGVAASFWQAFSIGAGYVYQQVNQLAPGLEEFQVIPAADGLRTNPRFKSGGYITVTVPIAKK